MTDTCTHCWHASYAGMGLWTQVCCQCGAQWIPEDYGDPKPPRAHGPYLDTGAASCGERKRTPLSGEEVFALFGLVPMTLEERLAHHDHSPSLPVHTHRITIGS